MEVKKLLTQVAEQPERHTKALKAFMKCYEGLQIGPYSNAVLQDVIENKTSNIASKFKKVASKQLDNSGISSSLLKANLMKGCDEVLHQFEVAITSLCESASAQLEKRSRIDR